MACNIGVANFVRMWCSAWHKLSEPLVIGGRDQEVKRHRTKNFMFLHIVTKASQSVLTTKLRMVSTFWAHCLDMLYFKFILHKSLVIYLPLQYIGIQLKRVTTGWPCKANTPWNIMTEETQCEEEREWKWCRWVYIRIRVKETSGPIWKHHFLNLYLLSYSRVEPCLKIGLSNYDQPMLMQHPQNVKTYIWMVCGEVWI